MIGRVFSGGYAMSELTMVKSVFAGGLGYASLYLAYHYLSTEFRPQLRRLARAGSVARTRIHRAWHVHVGPSRRQLEEARRTLGDRQYYELYDDLYRTMQSAGIETPDSRIHEDRPLSGQDLCRH